jgi:hypothetical protein
MAQWSIGTPTPHAPPAGEDQFAFLVITNPVPGHEAEFNDWYTNTHMGDLGQLEGWEGSQRFVLAPGLPRDQDTSAYRFGYLVIWDWQGRDAQTLFGRAGDAIRGGKSRLGAAFNYAPGASINVPYRALGARVTRPDGARPVMPRLDDNKTPRMNRYILAEFTDPPKGTTAEAYERLMKDRMAGVLAVPGWMAGRSFTWVATPGAPGSTETPPLPIYLTVWEIQAPSAADAQKALKAAMDAGTVKSLPAAHSTSLYWQPISPYVTKDMFSR